MRVPTISDPVGTGTAAEVVAARSDRTAAASPLLTCCESPDKATCCGLSGLLSLIDKEAMKEPADGGLNFTVIVQNAPAATLDAQSLVSLKAVGGLVPVAMIEMLVIESAAVPVFVKVAVWPGREEQPASRNLQLKASCAGMTFTVPLVSVMVALEDLVVSAAGIALR